MKPETDEPTALSERDAVLRFLEGFRAAMIDHSKADMLATLIHEIREGNHVTKAAACHHVPSGEQDLVGVLVCACPVCKGEHSARERCFVCGAWVPWHDFPCRRRHAAKGGE